MALALPKARVYGGSSTGGGGGDARARDPLHVDGMIFRLPDGTPWRWKGVSMFRALQRYDRGEDLTPLVDWTKAVGGNLWRVFGQFHRGIALSDVDIYHGSSPETIAHFVRWLHDRDLRVELTLLADCEQFGMAHSAQRQRLFDVVDALRHEPSCCLEIANEPFKNGADVRRLASDLGFDRGTRPVLMASGDYDVPDFNGPLVLDYFTHHPGRKEDWPVESGKEGHFIVDGWDPDANSTGYRGAHVAVVNDEPIGCAEVRRPWSRDDRPDAFEDGGAGMAIGSAGGTFHMDDGIQSVVPGPVQTECARRFFAAMDWFPADVPTGHYSHGGYGNHPLFETKDGSIGEDAARVCDDGRAFVVCACPTSTWSGPMVKPGWHITEVYPNSRGNILKLERS